jgi:L-arabinose isomerase
MKHYPGKEVWLITGSQDLYGADILKQVGENSRTIASGLESSKHIPLSVVAKSTVRSSAEILTICLEANQNPNCVGLVLWMHTFSPAKMWIAGLSSLIKPYLHLHTQFNAALPFSEINMNFMNLNQSAHGDREFGHIATRLRQERRVIVGHWASEKTQEQIGSWCRVAMGLHESRHLRIARFGDNMRHVAVTEGDKVSAQMQFGYEVHGYGLGDLKQVVDVVSEAQIASQIELYKKEYEIAPAVLTDKHQFQVLKNEAKLELGLLKFLTEGNFGAFTNTFENLTGLTNLPGLATQRLMAAGFGYGGEGDWKTAALVRIAKVVAKGRTGGTSFMEDYTYHFGKTEQVLGSHMLEICPSIADAKPKLEVHQHTIGITCDIARLVFTGKGGPALCVSVVDLGSRFRMIIGEVDSVTPEEDLPKLPVARTLWEPRPNLEIAGAAWILAGAAHHNVYTQAMSTDEWIDYAEMCGIEAVVIDSETRLRDFKSELRHNAVYFHLKDGV